MHQEIESTRLQIQATQSNFKQLVGQIKDTQQHLAASLLPQQMEAQVYGPANQIISEVQTALAVQKADLETLRTTLQQSAVDAAEKQAVTA